MQSLDAPASSLLLSQTSSDIRFGDKTSQFADSERNIQSALLLRSWNKWQCIEMPYYFSWFIALIFRDQSVYFCVSNCSWNCKPSGVCERSFSLAVKLWDKHGLTELPVIIYIYLYERIHASCLSYFSNRPFGIEQKLN